MASSVVNSIHRLRTSLSVTDDAGETNVWLIVDLDSRERAGVLIEGRLTRTSSQLRLTATASAAKKDAVLRATVYEATKRAEMKL